MYVAVGFFPWTAVEGDDIAIAAGASQLSLHGNLDHGFNYRYDPQAGTYLAVAALDRLLGIPPLAGFGLLTLAGFAAFFAFGTAFVARETRLPFPLAGLAILLFQESYVSAYYANSSMIAAGPLLAAVFLASRKSATSLLAAGVLFSLAILARFDAVFMAPLFLVVLFGRDRASLARVLLFFAASAAAFLLLSLLGGVSILRIWQEGSGHLRRFISPKQTLMNYLTLLSGAGCLLWFLGLRAALAERNWRVIVMSFAGWLPLVAAYGITVTTPKYLLYGLPFFTVLVACGLKWVLAAASRSAYWLRWACLGLLALQYVLGPLTLGSWLLRGKDLVVGTHDGLRRLDAVGYLPVMWLRAKLRYQQGLERAGAVLLATCGAEDRPLVLTGDWFSSKWTDYQLLRAGYRCVESVRHFDHIPIVTERDFHVYAKGNKRVSAFQIEWVDGPPAARDWRGRVALGSRESVLLLGRPERPSRLLGQAVCAEPLPGLSEFDRLPVFRIHPLPAHRPGPVDSEDGP